MGSNRLPGKVLADLKGKPMIGHVVDRVRRARSVDAIVVATSTQTSDGAIVDFCEFRKIRVFRGSEHDVLDRYYQCAEGIQTDVVVRITADCPLIDPRVIDKVAETFLGGTCDYASNTVERTYPDGLDVEIFSIEVLREAWKAARMASEREHVTPYIWKNPHLFDLCHIRREPDISHLRWTVDEPEDLVFVRLVYDQLYQPNGLILTEEVLALLDKHPELSKINSKFDINEGYRASLRMDDNYSD